VQHGNQGESASPRLSRVPHWARNALRGPASPMQRPRGLRPALGVAIDATSGPRLRFVTARRVRRRPECPSGDKGPPCCRHTLPESFRSRHKAGEPVGGVGNGERQIEIARRGADVIEEARAD